MGYRSCSKKLEALDYVGKIDARKLKKNHKKPVKGTASVPSEDTPEDDSQKPTKKKRTRLRRQKGVNANFTNTDEAPTARPIERNNSLKVFGVAKVAKPQQKPKSDTKKKFRRGSLVAAAAVHITKMKSKNALDRFSDGSSSEDLLAANRTRTINKKKKKTNVTKNRASSANVLFRNSKNYEK